MDKKPPSNGICFVKMKYPPFNKGDADSYQIVDTIAKLIVDMRVEIVVYHCYVLSAISRLMLTKQ